MYRKLTPQQFELKTIDDYKVKYFSWEGEGIELIIEPRLAGGYTVGVYDENGILKRDKVNVDCRAGEAPTKCFMRAIDQANKFLNEPELVVA